MTSQTRLFYALALANYLALLGLFAVWAIFFETAQVSFLIPLLARSLPIAIFLPGVLKKNQRTFAWLCFVAMLYICYGVLKAVEYPLIDGVFGILTTLFALDIIIFALLFIRAAGSHTPRDATR